MSRNSLPKTYKTITPVKALLIVLLALGIAFVLKVFVWGGNAGAEAALKEKLGQ